MIYRNKEYTSNARSKTKRRYNVMKGYVESKKMFEENYDIVFEMEDSLEGTNEILKRLCGIN